MKPRVLVVDDEPGMRQLLEIVLRKEGYEVSLAGRGSEALLAVQRQPFDILISDIRMPDISGIDLLREVKEVSPDTAVILMTAYATVQTALTALKLGAFDYLTKPFDVDEFKIVVRKAMERRRLIDENTYLRSELSGRGFGNVVYRSAAMAKVLVLVEQVAGTSSTVLLTGESGTGKGVIARSIHVSGARRAGKYLAINCAAIPEALLESELFGHVRGAFTGATATRRGLIEQADGGTLLLDEIGEMPLGMQVKLLQVLEDKKVRPVGGSIETSVDVRIVAATNRDLEKAVAAGRFREDLYYRLNVIRIELPPLRSRRDDIAPLAEHFRVACARELGKPVRGFTPEALARLEHLDWPGNVRQLENAVERAMTLATGELLGEAEFPIPSGAGPAVSLPTESEFDLEAHVDQVRRSYITEALRSSEGRQVDAARRLGMTFRSLRYYMKKYGIDALALGAGAGGG